MLGQGEGLRRQGRQLLRALQRKIAHRLGLPGFAIVAVGLKVLAASVLVFQRFSPREVLAAGTLLSARLSLVIAVAALGARLNLVNRELESQGMLLAVVTATARSVACV